MDSKKLKEKYKVVLPQLNERQKRLMLAAEAKAIGWGGISIVSNALGISRPTIYKGLLELKKQEYAEGRVRKEGGGRKKLIDINPEIMREVDLIVDPDTKGDPMSPLRWTCKSTRKIANLLKKKGYGISHNTVAKVLHRLGYSLQANKKTLEGSNHPDRDKQFHYINEQVKGYLKELNPVISVDTKKKELIGEYKNGGKEWGPKKKPVKVQMHDFPDPKAGKAIPYGVYDILQNKGWVNVGISHDTGEFAVSSIKRWWTHMGSKTYKEPKKILICADSGGSNGYRIKLWKVELQKWADDVGMEITVCHYPPGTSKWNKIEHKLFSHITMNWRAKPLTSYEVVVKLIGETTTKKGLKVTAKLDEKIYPAKLQVTKEQMRSLNLYEHQFHGEWNYTIEPRQDKVKL